MAYILRRRLNEVRLTAQTGSYSNQNLCAWRATDRFGLGKDQVPAAIRKLFLRSCLGSRSNTCRDTGCDEVSWHFARQTLPLLPTMALYEVACQFELF